MKLKPENTDKVYIIAELSANHNNDFDLAVKTIEAMANSGADAVKVQTYKPESLTLNLNTGYFSPKTEGLWKGYTPWELYTEASMPYEWQPKLQKIAHDLGLDFFSSPFDKEGVDFLEDLNVTKYKIASFEITDIPLIEYTASKGKPMIISTGVAELADIELAVKTCRNVGNDDITLLKCTSEYPSTFEAANLRTIPNIKETFGVKVGVSDHTMGSTVPIVAVAFGATVVEKHFILDRSLGGPDSTFSMEPDEFSALVKGIREAEASLGEITYEVSENNKLRRRSLFVAKDIKKGEVITEEHLKSVRPGHGMHPKHYLDFIGTAAIKDYIKGEPFYIKT
ncbi:MAG: pseudaminic acid synthase [Bacteroidetes bacterium]|nr:MAG: pseudaminic acid synthase [Bacteroidota bacterium]